MTARIACSPASAVQPHRTYTHAIAPKPKESMLRRCNMCMKHIYVTACSNCCYLKLLAEPPPPTPPHPRGVHAVLLAAPLKGCPAERTILCVFLDPCISKPRDFSFFCLRTVWSRLACTLRGPFYAAPLPIFVALHCAVALCLAAFHLPICLLQFLFEPVGSCFLAPDQCHPHM